MGIAPYEPDWGTRQNMLEGPQSGAPFLLLWDILFFDVPPEKRGDLRPGKGREQIQVLILIAL